MEVAEMNAMQDASETRLAFASVGSAHRAA